MKNKETKLLGEIMVMYKCKILDPKGKDVTLEYRKYSDNLSYTQWADGFTVEGEAENIAFDIKDNNDIHDHDVEVIITLCVADVKVMRKVSETFGAKGALTTYETIRTEHLDLMTK